MDKRHFQLKPSKLAVIFQLSIFAILMGLLYQVLNSWLWLLCLIMGILIYIKFYKSNTEIILQYLGGSIWTLLGHHLPKQDVEISHLIDHQAYIVVYFKYARAKPLLIWCDQLSSQQWKQLKVLAKML